MTRGTCCCQNKTDIALGLLIGITGIFLKLMYKHTQCTITGKLMHTNITYNESPGNLT